MAVGDGDALFGQDGTGGITEGPSPDGIGPLPGFELPVVRLPVIGPDGSIRGLDAFDGDLDAGPPFGTAAAPPVTPQAPGPARAPAVDDPSPDRGHGQVHGVAGPTPWPTAAQRAALGADPTGRPSLPAARHAPARRPAARPPLAAPEHAPARPLTARPRVEHEPSLLGFTRRSSSRAGSRAFALFFVLVFTVIVVHMLVVLVNG
jgi:hypothetical protein